MLGKKKVRGDTFHGRSNFLSRIPCPVSQLIESVVTVDLDEDGKVIRLLDQWNGNELPTFFGSTFLRTANAKVVPWLVHVPKD